MPIVTRFAPSPTGRLHLGHAYAAWFAWHHARTTGGRFLLRIEDIDFGRCRPDFAAGILDDLAWLGLDWDGAVRQQSEHMADYAAVLDELTTRGLLYPCFCTRAALALSAPHAEDAAGIYFGTCRTLSAGERADRIAAGERYAWRLDVARALAQARSVRFLEEGQGWVDANPGRFGDVVLARKDTPCSYHLCVTHDDAAQGVTLVTRGRDLLEATALQVLLQRLMGWPTPRYAHHDLLLDAQGRRLAKRDSAATITALRESGRTPAEVRRLAQR